MTTVLKWIIGHKKLSATIAAILTPILNGALAQVGAELDQATVQNVIYALMAYVLGQGIADNGKEAEKVKQAKPKRTRKTKPKPMDINDGHLGA